MNNVSKISVFMYFDYRDFLGAVLENIQKNDKKASLRSIQESIGVQGSGFFTRILAGDRPLSIENAKTIANAWGMDAAETEYFFDMVRFGNEKNVDKREVLLKKLIAARADNAEYALQDSAMQFFSKWYYPVLRDLLPLLPVNTPAEKIGRMFTPVLRAPQVNSGINYLLKSGFVLANEDGTYSVTEPIVSTPPRVRSTILRKYHIKNLEINQEVYDEFTVDDRSMTSVTCSLSKESFEKVRAEIAALRDRILALAREDKNPDRVCHVGFQLVPRAKVQGGKK